MIHIVGIGADGAAGLSAAARALVESAETLVGGKRHLTFFPDFKGEKLAWPSPFSALVGEIKARRGRRVAVLVTGDPLWFSAGRAFAEAFAPDEMTFHPHVSAFQLVALRMLWPLEEVQTMSLHGRPLESFLLHLHPGAKILALSADDSTPGAVAGLLARLGWGPSRLVAFGEMGGPQETRHEATAEAWAHRPPALNTLAIEARPGPGARPLSRIAGLPDDAFIHDGKMTKREVRAVTLALLAPQPGALLWDVGAGCGSIAIEWMRAATGARAIGLEPDDARRALAAQNALALGVPGLELRAALAPAGLADLPDPDAVFIGGGLTEETAELCLKRLKPFGRLAANAVTLESEAVLLKLFARHGGELRRLSVARADGVGSLTGWRPHMPVTQWSLVKV